ncbi:MAG: hypothetical protein Q9162_003137 [Coniocarpon cinnabarinum]
MEVSSQIHNRKARANAREERVFTRHEIAGLIAQNRTIIIVEQRVLQVDSWLPFHPGGEKAIMHQVGRDATDEVTALHSEEAVGRMKAFQIGRIEGVWDNFTPPIQGGMFHQPEVCDVRELEEEHEGTMSDSEVSESPSPVFDVPTERGFPGLHLRLKRSNDSTSESSHSSLDDTDNNVDDPTALKDPQKQRTRQELTDDLARYPSLSPVVQGEIVSKYRLLNRQIKDEGLYECNYMAYAIECVRYVLLFLAMLFCLNHEWYTTSAVLLGAFWHQLVFTAHDAGHMGITHCFQVDTVIGIIIADFLGGLSLGWWKRNHNVHHIVTNSPEHDPDIEHMPFFAISHRFLDDLKSTFYDRIMTYDSFAKFTLRYQHYLYYPILCFGRFNLYFLSWEYLLRGLGPRKGVAAWHRWLELAGQVFFWTWFGYGILYHLLPTNHHRIVFVLVSHAVTMPLHVQITLSHFAMSTSDLGQAESFPQKMLRTTMDVDCPAWLDFLHGGLQFQAVHHLYPRIPRHNLRRCQKLVMQFCEDTGIPYALYGFEQGNRQVISRMSEVANQARILAECQRAASKDYLSFR